MVTTNYLFFCYIGTTIYNNVPILGFQKKLHFKKPHPVKKSLILLFLITGLSLVSCFEDQDDVLHPASTVEINDFIWRGLNYFYLYKTDTPELADDAFATDADYKAFLDSFETPEAFFAYLKSAQDRFSILVDDYVELENALSGITLNNGMEYGLVYYPDDSNNVFGYVRYVLPNSDAASKGVQRGMVFNTIDGTQLNDQNFDTLLSPDSYTIGLASFDGTTIMATGDSISLTKAQYTENPVFKTSVLNIGGHSIGYIMYNAFTSEFDSQLNTAFGQFKSMGITDLVVDLRYNGGGSVRSATYLSSMITCQFTGQVFYTEQWNPDRQADYAEDGKFLSSFVSGGESINSLNLSKVYIITSSRTASASELVINGLAPYIDVVQIGANTTGKYQASFLLYDAPAPNFSRAQVNPNHRYAMLPLVFKTANAAGNTDYVDGLIPDIEQFEDYSNLGVLGNENEPLLATAIAAITGLPTPGIKKNTFHKTISERKALVPGYQMMWVEKDE